MGMVDEAAERLNLKAKGGSLGGTARFVLEGEGTILMDDSGARAGDGEADVTLSADPDTFRAILEGDLDATAAFMQGRLKVDGDMGLAMRLASVLG